MTEDIIRKNKIIGGGADTRIVYADVLRIIATFAVVVLHTAASSWYDTPVKSFDWQIMNFFDSLVRWAVPIFFMLSGMFFLNPEKEIHTKKIYSKNIVRMLTALIFWGLFYNLISILVKVIKHTNTKAIITEIITAFVKIPFGTPWYHLWFLYAIIGMYILTPIFRIFTKNAEKKDFEYLLIAFAIFGTVFPTMEKIIKSIDSRLSIHQIAEMTGYAGYYFAGYYFSKFELKPKTKKCFIFAGIVSMIFTILATSLSSIYKNEPIAFFYGNLQPTTMFEAFGLFIFVKDLFEKYSLSERRQKTVFHLSKLTFGIYLVHDFFNIVFNKIGFSTVLFTSIIMIPIRAIAVFCLSAFSAFAISKIKPLNKYIM